MSLALALVVYENNRFTDDQGITKWFKNKLRGKLMRDNKWGIIDKCMGKLAEGGNGK